jgi:outer membrane protein OmpA-like peptidoglycan-associated protein
MKFFKKSTSKFVNHKFICALFFIQLFFSFVASNISLIKLQWRRSVQHIVIGQHFFASILSNKKNVLAICFFSFFITNNTKAQNYFANADFEALNNCTEYHQDCSPRAWFYLKPAVTPLINYKEVPTPFAGKDLLILPVENVFKKITKRSFIYTKFCCPLKAGNNYKLSFYICTKGKTFYGLDFHFSDKEYISENFKPDSFLPSIHISADDVETELGGWKFVETMYTANGKEKFCYIGNMSRSALDFSINQRMNKGGDVFYFLDDIAFQPLAEERLCNQYYSVVNQLNAQTLRHTEGALVDTKNYFKDTLIVPSVYFETDKAVIKPAFKKLLLQLIKNTINKNLIAIDIEGHTDNVGTEEHNNELSLQRANAVKQFFIEKSPSSRDIISTSGKAATVPIADNTTTTGRAKNRRVQIIVTYTL